MHISEKHINIDNRNKLYDGTKPQGKRERRLYRLYLFPKLYPQQNKVTEKFWGKNIKNETSSGGLTHLQKNGGLRQEARDLKMGAPF